MERCEFVIRAGEDPSRRLGEIRARGWRLESFRTTSSVWLLCRPHGPHPPAAGPHRDEVVTVLACVRAGQEQPA
jgi:hypothetical protein